MMGEVGRLYGHWHNLGALYLSVCVDLLVGLVHEEKNNLALEKWLVKCGQFT